MVLSRFALRADSLLVSELLVMAITTEPPRDSGQLRSESINESQVSSRLRRGSGPLRDGSLTGDRPTGRLRPISSASIHDTVVPDKQPSFDPTRKLSPAEFNTAMAHFYRGEIQRSNTWRNRLDTTTNWAVLSAGAMVDCGSIRVPCRQGPAVCGPACASPAARARPCRTPLERTDGGRRHVRNRG